ncbi:rod shape-determining protein MreC [Candidatus Daviesbacteria bacterium]|nr:rod shape-determining protein MreC [Candidatus Daviesbacteria bacterium]
MQPLLEDVRLFLTLILLAALLILADDRQVLDLPKSAAQKVTIPIQYGLYKNSIFLSRQVEFIFLARRAAKENKALNAQLADVLSENARLRKELAEAQSFLAQEKALSSKTFNLIPVRPIGLSRYLLIDKGSDDGLKVNMSVIYKDNFMGQIKEVSPQKSTVLLSSDPDSKVAAFSANQNGRTKGILVGQFGSQSQLDKILHQEPIAENDLIYSEGTEGEIPRGLVLGRVVEVINQDNQIFKQAKVKPIYDITNLDILFVITN